MPATAADIAAGTRPSVTATWSDATIKARYPSAKDALAQPADGWFDTVADAQSAVDARGALLGTERRRFAVKVDGVTWIDPTAGLPQALLVDAEQNANLACLAPRYAVDLDAETTAFELIG